MAMRLSDFPYVLVRIECVLCPRKGRYRLARLAATFGPEIRVDELLDELARDCPYRRGPGERRPGKYGVKCGARFADLGGNPTRPPDLPPAVMRPRLVAGGKE